MSYHIISNLCNCLINQCGLDAFRVKKIIVLAKNYTFLRWGKAEIFYVALSSLGIYQIYVTIKVLMKSPLMGHSVQVRPAWKWAALLLASGLSATAAAESCILIGWGQWLGLPHWALKGFMNEWVWAVA